MSTAFDQTRNKNKPWWRPWWPLLWLYCRPRRECCKEYPATQLAGFGGDAAIVEEEGEAW